MRTVRALVVDDAADMRFLIGAILEDAGTGARVAEAATGAEALDVVDGVAFDVVILDARMPGMDGYETAARIRRRRPEQRIILCTSAVDDSVWARAREAGADAVLSKGELDRLPALVAAVVNGTGERR
jgi:CheY-like chemotaxis protein